MSNKSYKPDWSELPKWVQWIGQYLLSWKEALRRRLAFYGWREDEPQPRKPEFNENGQPLYHGLTREEFYAGWEIAFDVMYIVGGDELRDKLRNKDLGSYWCCDFIEWISRSRLDGGEQETHSMALAEARRYFGERYRTREHNDATSQTGGVER